MAKMYWGLNETGAQLMKELAAANAGNFIPATAQELMAMPAETAVKAIPGLVQNDLQIMQIIGELSNDVQKTFNTVGKVSGAHAAWIGIGCIGVIGLGYCVYELNKKVKKLERKVSSL